MKRIACTVLALLLSVGLCLTAAASENPENDYYIGESNGYEIWMLNPISQPMSLEEVIGDYLFEGGSILRGMLMPTAIFAVKNGQEIYIKDAYEQGLVDIAEVARIVDGFSYDGYLESSLYVHQFGDVDRNKKLEVLDAMLIQKIIAKVSYFDILSDVNHDDEINLEDVILLQKKIAKIEA